MKKINRNDSADTLRKNSKPYVFNIYYMQELVDKVSCKIDDTVSDLIQKVRHHLSKRFECIVGLSTVDKHFTLDYALTLKNYPISNFHNNQRFQLILEQVVSDLEAPSLSDFTFLKYLGEGISAAVFLVRHNSNGKLYALKQIKKQYFRQFKTMESVLRQKKILTQMVSDLPFVTKLIGSFQSGRHLNLLLQFYPGGEMFYHLTLKKCTQQEAKICFAQILVTMEQLHSKQIIYRDLKPENIMIDFDGHLILGDFGLCKINLDKYDLTYSCCGSPEYMAPQTKTEEGYNYSVDFYTMGAIIYEMVTGVPPYYQNAPLEFSSDVSYSFIEIVKKLIHQDRKKRLTNFGQIKKLKWLQNIDWEKLLKKQYKMPFKLNPYICYIHDEFKEKSIVNSQLKFQEKYDKLFDLFFYLNPCKNGIKEFYPFHSKRFKKYQNIKNTRHSKNKRQRKNSNSKDFSRDSKSYSKDRSVKGSNKKKVNGFKRENIQNIYTSHQQSRHSKNKNDTSSKSQSKGKKANLMTSNALKQNKSPIKFNKLTKAKSTQFIKPSNFVRQLGKQITKTKYY